MVEADNECNLPCKQKLWDGYGRWNIDNQWKPFMEEINLPSSKGKFDPANWLDIRGAIQKYVKLNSKA